MVWLFNPVTMGIISMFVLWLLPYGVYRLIKRIPLRPSKVRERYGLDPNGESIHGIDG